MRSLRPGWRPGWHLGWPPGWRLGWRPGWHLSWMVAFAACGQPAPPPPLTGHPDPAVPVTPEPTVQWAARQITTTGLPASASDGGTFVIAQRDSDGGRGNPNLTLIEKDRGDREIGRLVVLTATEADDLAPAEIQDRFAQAGRWIHERHRARHLVPMTALAARMPSDDAPAQATGGGVTLRCAPNQLALDHGPSALLRRATPASWLADDYPLCRGCSEVCHNEAFLGGGYLDLAHTAVIAVISYRGTDTCWEPGSRAHVVTW